ncbi:hypothetical protein BH09MYX1_BH09MYX1_51330 [soil metagenome]
MTRFPGKFAFGLAALLLVACGGPLKYQVASTDKAKGADATIKAEAKTAEHQMVLSIDAVNLAPPTRITDGAKAFVVWARKSTAAQWSRVGNFTYDESARSAKFNGTFPELEFDIEISVEKDDNAGAPSSDIIFSQHIGPG